MRKPGKILVFAAGLLVLTLAATAASAQAPAGLETASATTVAPARLSPTLDQVPEPVAASVLPVACYSTCRNGESVVGFCDGTLAFCCAANRRLYCAHFGGGYLYGYCTDGTSSLGC